MAIKTPTGGETITPQEVQSTDVEIAPKPTDVESTQQEVVRQPLDRSVAQATSWDKSDKQYGFNNKENIQDKKSEILSATVQEMVNGLPTNEKMGVNALMTLPSLAEDLYNTGVDIVNGVSSAFDGADLLERSKTISNMLPKGMGYEMSREIGKFLSAYALGIKGLTALTGGKPTKAIQISAGVVSEFILAKQEQETLTEMLVQKIPVIGGPVYEYLNGEDDGPLEHRLKQSLLGVAEGEAAELLFKSIKYLKKVRKAEADTLPEIPVTKVQGEVIDVAGEAAEDIVVNPPKVPAQVADIPELPEIFKPVTKGQVKEVKYRQNTGKGSVNAVDIVDKDGNEVYMNLTTLDVEDDTRKVIANIIESNPTRYAKKTYTSDDLIQMGDALDLEPEEVATWVAESGLQPGQILAASDMVIQAGSALNAAFKRFDAGEITEDVVAGFMAKTAELTGRLKDMKSAAGLMLKEADISVKAGQTQRTQAQLELNRVFSGDIKAISKALTGWNIKSTDMLRALNKSVVSPIADTLVSIRYAGMLSNINTHLRNLYGNTITGLTRPGETLLAATVNSVERNPHGVHFGDAYHELVGMGQGILDALIISGKKLKGKDAKFIGVDPKKAKLPQFLDETLPEAKSNAGKFAGFIKNHVVKGQFVGQALQFEDNFAKHINATMTWRREAYRKGRLATANGGDKAAVDAAISKELAEPSSETLSKMYKDAEYNTFTNDVEGPILKTLENASNSPLGRLIAPFAKINLNTMSYKLERIPGLNLTLKKSREELLHSDPQIRQKALAKLGFTSTLMYGLATQLLGTDSITGVGVNDKSKFKIFEQSGRLQGAIKVGDDWIEYRRETPMGGILSMFADYAQIRDAADGTNDKYLEDTLSAYASILMEAYNPEYLTESVGELFQAMTQGDAKKVRNVLAGVAESFAPYSGFFRNAMRQATAEGGIKRETTNPGDFVETILAKLKNIYAPQMNAVKKNILGYPMHHKTGLGPDIASPFGINQETDNPVIQELARLAGAHHLVNPKTAIEFDNQLDDSFISVTMPPKSLKRNIGGVANQSVRLDLNEYSDLIEYTSGRAKEFGGNTLEKTLSGMIKSDSYKSAPFRMKGIMVKRIIEAYRAQGTAAYLGTPMRIQDFKKAVKEASRILE